MPRRLRTPRTLLLLTLTSLLATACDDRGPLGPLDDERDKQQLEQQDHVVQAVVAPVDLDLEWALGNKLVVAERGSELVARIRIEAPDKLDLPRPPAHVVLVVDTSGSMQGDAIDGAKQAAAALVDSLSDGDSFALVVFHSRAEVLMPATVIGERSRAAARAEIEKMQAWGTTDLAGGLRLALAQLDVAPITDDTDPNTAAWVPPAPGMTPLERVVLLGDGVPNDGTPIAGLTQQFVARGVEVTALGYGLEYDEVLLASLAEQTHGHYQFVEQPDAVATLFRDEVLDVQRTVARDLRLGFGLGPGVRLIEVVGHATEWNPSAARQELVLGSIAEGQTQELIVRLEIGPHSAGAVVELSDLELGYVDVHTQTGPQFERSFMAATATADAAAIEASRDLEVARAAARARTNDATLDVLSLAHAGQVEQAKALLEEAVKWAKMEAKGLSDSELEQQAKQLAALAPELAKLARTPVVAPPSSQPSSQPSYAPQAFAEPPSPAASRQLKAAHSEAYNDLHD